jgi:hypothetical protein
MYGTNNDDKVRGEAIDQTKDDDLPAVLSKEKRLLNPVDRISEILFGLIMALTFTCTLSVATSNKADVRTMLISALGCNLAWGLVDAVMFILTGLAERGHGKIILKFVHMTENSRKASEVIAQALPPIVASVIEAESLERIRKRLSKLPASSLRVKVTRRDLKMAFGIFLLVFFSTIPIALPFTFIDDAQKALRISNLVAIVLMFVSGWLLARYGGYNKWLMGLSMVVLGIILVTLTIALGG